MKANIYLLGFMGSGKTSVGRSLAESLGRRFVDLDAEVEKSLGCPVAEIFAGPGEAAFRRAEKEALVGLAAGERLIVATGGGVVEDPENVRLMKASGRLVHLETEFETCRARLGPDGADHRPMWRRDEAARRLHHRRQRLYAQADLSLKTDGLSADETAQAVAGLHFPDRAFPVKLEGWKHLVVVTRRGPDALAGMVAGRKVAVLTDRRVAGLHLARYRAVLDDPLEIVLPGGERIKTLRGAERIYQALLKNHFDRDDLLVALGGGAVTDLGAFAAATYKRGLGFVLVATSLLGGVDAAVGGKAAVNLGPAKNVVGCFTRPEAVVLDTAAFRTLSRPRLSEGLVEAYKTGLVASPGLARLIEAEAETLLAGDGPLLAEAAGQSARAKAAVVAGDFREAGRRAVLNLGHTFGHAVESFYRFRVSHGRAVALGLRVAARLSYRRGLLSEEQSARIEATVDRLSPRPPACPPVDAAFEIMAQDKKKRRGRLVFVLLDGPGRPRLVDDLSRAELAAVLAGPAGVVEKPK
ncbi:MAG: bifunctional shikimate kinase/3-dehydroquinate synthase [Thermodesulfobacteriota bacterium]